MCFCPYDSIYRLILRLTSRASVDNFTLLYALYIIIIIIIIVVHDDDDDDAMMTSSTPEDVQAHEY